MIDEINKARNIKNAFTESCQQGIANQEINRRKRQRDNGTGQAGARRKPAPPPEPEPEPPRRKQTRPATPPPPPAPEPADDANASTTFVLRRHPSESAVQPLDREFLRTSNDLKVGW